MRKFQALLISITGITIIHSTAITYGTPAAIAQEAEGCFMVNPSGQIVDLSKVCGITKKVSTTTNPSGFQAKIKRREGGVPVIDVTFNGKQKFEMLVDTGAGGTLLTRKQAAALKVIPVAKIKASTASDKEVEFPVGYVQSIEVNKAVVKDVQVAIAGSDLEIGLLGQDFFGNYDVILRRDVVEFHLRQHDATQPPV